jgi:hypothetical protein
MPGAVSCLPHAIWIDGHDYTVRQMPPLTLPPDSDFGNFVGTIVNGLSPNIAMKQRVLLPTRFPYSLFDAARLLGLPFPRQIGVVGSFQPIVVSSQDSSTTYYLRVKVLAFNAVGQFVCLHDAQSWELQLFSGNKAILNDAIKKVDRSTFKPKLGFLQSPYYSDTHAVVVDLDSLCQQGIYSIAIWVETYSSFSVARFRKKAIRIVDLASNIEIGLFHIAFPWVSKKWSLLAGGIAFANDVWSWVPAGDLIANQNMAQCQHCWYQRLLQSQSITPQ